MGLVQVFLVSLIGVSKIWVLANFRGLQNKQVYKGMDTQENYE